MIRFQKWLNVIVGVLILGTLSPFAFASLDLDRLTYKTAQESKRTANVRLDAFSIVAHGYELSVDVPLSHGWTFGPSLFHYPQSYSLYNFTADGIGFVALKYFNGKAFRSGWYVGPMAYLVQSENHVAQLGRTPAGYQLGLRGGYQWVWNRFNVQLGAASLYLTGLGSVSGAIQGDLNLGFVL